MRASPVDELISELLAAANPEKAAFLQGYFKTGPGEYGEGDQFLGLTVPITRAFAKKYFRLLSTSDIDMLLQNSWHEIRTVGVMVMGMQFVKADESCRKELYELYLSHIGRGINNWDLIDGSANVVVGGFLYGKDRSPIDELARGGLWHKRTAIIASRIASLRITL